MRSIGTSVAWLHMVAITPIDAVHTYTGNRDQRSPFTIITVFRVKTKEVLSEFQ